MILCVGLNYQTSSAGIRESVALTPEETAEALEALRKVRAQEALILSTCNRTEFYARGSVGADPLDCVADIIKHLKGIDLREHQGATYVWNTADPVPHLFRVTSGLDSMVLGETQIAGQVRVASELASKSGMHGPVLRRLVDSAVHCARRVRTETSLTEGSVSMASVAVGLATKVLGDLAHKRVLIVGAGDTGRTAAEHLKDIGAHDFMVANRSPQPAQELAARVGGTAHGLDELARLLQEADLVFSATASAQPLIDVEMVRQASKARRGRSMLLVDLAMPRDVHPDVNKLPNVFVYSTEAVKSIVDDNLERRRREAPRAEAIVLEEAARFLDWYRGLAVTPTVASVRARMEQLRAKKVEAFATKFRSEDREKLETLSRSLMNDFLREPTLRLMRAKDDPRLGPELAEAVRNLFDLEGPESADAAPGPEPSHEDRNQG